MYVRMKVKSTQILSQWILLIVKVDRAPGVSLGWLAEHYEGERVCDCRPDGRLVQSNTYLAILIFSPVGEVRGLMKDEKKSGTMTGASILWECLEREGVQEVFGYPGGAILPAYDALKHSKIHHILVRHEQGATHMADGYARASGEVGVAVATSGPGATNMVTGIATAMLDSSPIVCITGQVGSKLIGSDAFQETDITGITLPITKHNYLVTHADQLARVLREAFYVARSGRPGPVLVDITKDAQQASTEWEWEAAKPQLPGYRPDLSPEESEYAQALELIHNSKRPVILAGQGIIVSGAMT